MSIYKDLLFLHGHVFDPSILADVVPAPPAEAPAEPARAPASRARRPRPTAPLASTPAAPLDCCA